MSDRSRRRRGVGRLSVTAFGLCFLLLAGLEISRVPAIAVDHAEESLAPDFLLRDQHGRTYRLSDRRGRVVVLAFGYTHCPDRCSVTLGAWKRAHDRLGDRAKEIDFVYITVDPKRDTAEALGKRLATFSEDFFGLSGSESELAEVYRRYDVQREEAAVSDRELEYLVSHPFGTIVIDRRGRIARELPYISLTANDEDLVEAIGSALGG